MAQRAIKIKNYYEEQINKIYNKRRSLHVVYSIVQYSIVQYSTVQYCTALYCIVQYSTVQYSTVQYSTVQYSTVQYCTVLKNKSTNTLKYLSLISYTQGAWFSLNSDVPL